MSFQIVFDILEDGTIVLPHQYVEHAPVGQYLITGHKETEGTAGNLVSLSTPIGNISASMNKLVGNTNHVKMSKYTKE